jgi:hypothetical protein
VRRKTEKKLKKMDSRQENQVYCLHREPHHLLKSPALRGTKESLKNPTFSEWLTTIIFRTFITLQVVLISRLPEGEGK